MSGDGERDGALLRLAEGIPYARFLHLRFERRGEELTAVLPFRPALLGNPRIPALHGGATASFLEVAAIVELAWSREGEPEGLSAPLPKTIDFSVDFLRPGLSQDAFARARVERSGRRYASVHVEAWQDRRDRPFAQASGHFLMAED